MGTSNCRRTDPVFDDIRSHLAAVDAEAQVYDPQKSHGYAWWFRQMYNGYMFKVLYGDGEDGVEYVRNIVAIATKTGERLPRNGETIYLEVPDQFGIMRALGEEVHFYLLDSKPQSVGSSLLELVECPIAFKGHVKGSNEDGVDQGQADWIIRDLNKPVLQSTGGTVTPIPNPTTIQVFIQIDVRMEERFKYIFDPAGKWHPVYADDNTESVVPDKTFVEQIKDLNLIPREDQAWEKVVDLVPSGKDLDEESWKYKELSPDSGRFFLVSRRRLRLKVESQRAIGKQQVPVSLEDATATAIPAEVWYAVAKWAKENQKLEGWQRSLAYSVGRTLASNKPISDKQEKQGLRLLKEAMGEGFSHTDLIAEE